jgi:hypothetical protein
MILFSPGKQRQWSVELYEKVFKKKKRKWNDTLNHISCSLGRIIMYQLFNVPGYMKYKTICNLDGSAVVNFRCFVIHVINYTKLRS